MGAPVKIAVAGGGYGAKVALPVYARLDEFEPVAVWSRRPERAAELAGDMDLELGTADFDEMLALPGLEAVHVATPVVTHRELGRAVLDRGLHLLCEKPLASSLPEALQIADAARAAGVVAAVNYGRRFEDTRRRLLERAREVAGQARLASVSLVMADHADPDSRPFTWVHDATLGGGRLQGYGVHDLDLLLELFPDVEAVAAAAEVTVPQRVTGDGHMRTVTAEDAFGILMRLRGGGLAVVSFVATARHGRGDVIEIQGAKGTVRLDGDGCLTWGRAGEELQVEGPLDSSPKAAFEHVARRFFGAVREDAAPDPSLDEALRVQAVFDAVRVADAERRWVAPAPVPPIG
ncbi:MAG TPA: Gfo/Idh/MocA family oxidoreductase [Solirubrobacteraceae bacterium]|nr:Gfo/Idh/MocA family oxidoreductase [Solirubrobacteraceae bacterium]